MWLGAPRCATHDTGGRPLPLNFPHSLDSGESGHDVLERARQIRSTMAALHEPDMVAGGRLTSLAHPFGDSSANSAIGASWRTRLPVLDQFVQNAIQRGLGNQRLNVRLPMTTGPQ